MVWSGLALVTAAPAAASADTAESEFLTKLNQERVNRGLPALVSDTKLAPTSRSWSANMGSKNSLYHEPNLAAVASTVEPNWRSVGENVGVGYGVQGLHDAFMGSTGHRNNILSSKYNRVGIGVAYAHGKTWVTVRFLEGPAITGTTGLGPPPPPPGVRTVLTGDFDGDGYEDVLTYGPGGEPDELWFGRADGHMRKVPATVNGHYRPIAGDFDGDTKSEIIWYAPGTTQDFIWSWNGSGWDSTPTTINGTYQPLVGDFDGDGVDDILWYAPGPAADFSWYGNRTGDFTSVGTQINGSYRPLVGDLDGNRGDDIFWYAPGPASDWIWYSVKQRGSYANTHTTVNGHYRAFTGNFNGDASDDIFWYAPGPAQDFIWFMSTTRGRYSSVARTVNGHYLPAAADINGDRADDVVWFSPSHLSGDPIWFGQRGSTAYVSSSVRSG
jgi:hypothetical protein